MKEEHLCTRRARRSWGPFRAELEASRDLALKLRVSCPDQCDLKGGAVRIVDEAGALVKESALVSFGEAGNETEELIVKVPTRPGKHTWTISFTARAGGSSADVPAAAPSGAAPAGATPEGQAPESEIVTHADSSTTLSFVVKPHATSMAVWDIPTPILCDDHFKVKVGATCCASCNLTGQPVEIYDQDKQPVASATLGDSPWPGTSALYWTEVELTAPGLANFYQWTVKLPKPELAQAHQASDYAMPFRAARRPDHVVTVEVVDKQKQTPLPKAYVLLHPYSGYTDETGVARVSVAKGDYQLEVLLDDYIHSEITASVAGDVTYRVELVYSPPPL